VVLLRGDAAAIDRAQTLLEEKLNEAGEQTYTFYHSNNTSITISVVGSNTKGRTLCLHTDAPRRETQRSR